MIDLTPIDDIEIPDNWFTFLSTGYTIFDNLFAQHVNEANGQITTGIRQGSAIVFFAGRGLGKTRLLMQACHEVKKNMPHKNVGFLTNEMSCAQIRNYANALQVKQILVGSVDSFEQVEYAIKEYNLNMLVVDSYSMLDFAPDENGQQLSAKEKIQKFVKLGQEYHCAMVAILHMTKGKAHAGAEVIPHTVDAVYSIRAGSKEFYGTDKVRIISCEGKNREGEPISVAFAMNNGRYDLSQGLPLENLTDSESAEQVHRKTKLRDKIYQEIIIYAQNHNNVIDSDHLADLSMTVDELEGDVPKAKRYLMALVENQKLVKTGRGNQTIWTAMSSPKIDLNTAL